MKHVKLFEQFVNEEKINIKKEVKRLKKMGYDASAWNDGIMVDGINPPNSNYGGTVTMAWDSWGIYCDDDNYAGNDESYAKFLDIIEYPENTVGEWE